MEANADNQPRASVLLMPDVSTISTLQVAGPDEGAVLGDGDSFGNDWSMA
jgi:hypothetical protein